MAQTPSANDRGIDVDELPVINLTEKENQIIHHIAKLRNLTYQDIDGGQVVGNQSSFQAHLTGARGEFAVAKYFDGLSSYDTNVFLPHGDGGVDFYLAGEKIDVKTSATDMDVPDLLIPKNRPINSDWFVLAHVLNPSSVRIIGICSKEEVTNHPIRRAPGERRNYWIPPEDLNLFSQ